MKELAEFLTALGKLLAALDRGAGQEQPADALHLPQAEPVTDCNQLPAQDGEPAAETVTDSHHLPEAEPPAEPVGNPDTLPAEATVDNLSTPPPKLKKKPWTCVCTCQKCGAEFRATHRDAKFCPSCRSAIRRENMIRVRQEYLDKMQASAPAAPKQEDAGTEPADGGE